MSFPYGSDGLGMFVEPITDGRRLAAHRVANTVRALIDGLIASPASAAELDALQAELAKLTEGLSKRPATAVSGRAEQPGADAPSNPGSLFQDYSPVIGLANPSSPPLSMRVENGKVLGHCTFGVAFEGPPAHVHGGWVATVFDEILGLVQALPGSPGMTGRLQVKYRRPMPLHVRIDWEGEIVEIDGRKIHTIGRAFDSRDGALLAESEALFISIDFNALSALQNRTSA